jgi:antitoxin VapB
MIENDAPEARPPRPQAANDNDGASAAPIDARILTIARALGRQIAREQLRGCARPTTTALPGNDELTAATLAARFQMIYTYDVHQLEDAMADAGIARIFMHGRSQAVRLPLAFRLPGDRVRVRRVEGGILLEPMVTDLDTWFAELDRFADVPFMEEGRQQPPMPEPKDLFA